jgi:2-dehydropantoate 2-reductase
MVREKLTVGAIGVGPIGTILATCLAKAGAQIVVADLPHRVAQVKERGLQVRWEQEGWRLDYPAATVDSIHALSRHRPDCIFIATKAYSLGKIMPAVATATENDCLVISVQNGIGCEDEIARHIPPRNVCRMVVNYAAGSDEKGVAHMNWFNPPNAIGLLGEPGGGAGRAGGAEDADPRLTRFAEMLNAGGLTTDLVDPLTIKKKAFLKTTLNAALMPICAVMGLTMKEAMSGPATRRLAGDILREALAVAERLGYDYGPGMWEECLGYLDKGGDHHPSMSVDLEHQRPTEIDFINGKILEQGRAFPELSLEVNRVMVSLVMTREVRNGTRKPEEIPEHLAQSPEQLADDAPGE